MILKSSLCAEIGRSNHGNLVKLNYYDVDLDSTRLRVFREVAARNSVLNSPPVSTLAGVQPLYDKRIWVEIDGSLCNLHNNKMMKEKSCQHKC